MLKMMALSARNRTSKNWIDDMNVASDLTRLLVETAFVSEEV
jgi:hypothetical protein